MPDFAMPPEAAEPFVVAPPAHPQPRHGLPADADREPPLDEAIDPIGPPTARRPWRHLLAATLIGVLLGAGLTSAAQGMERAAGADDRARLAAAAMAYLTAIAEGRAAEATRLVPPPARFGAADLLTDRVLSASGRITQPRAGFAQIDGDEARIDVGFILGRDDVSLTLEGARDGDGWRITTSLAERVPYFAFGPGARTASIAGAPMSAAELLLYPATYMTDATDDGLISIRSVTFAVDGDARTTVEVAPMVEIAPDLAERLAPVALAYGIACQQRDGCGIPPGQLLSSGQLQPLCDGAGAAEVSVLLTRSMGAGAEVEWHEVRMRGELRSESAAWECGVPTLVTGRVGEWEPCAP